MTITVDNRVDFPVNQYTVGKSNGEHVIVNAEHAKVDHDGDLIFSNLTPVEFYEYYTGYKIRFTLKRLKEAEHIPAGTWSTFGLITSH